MEVDVGKEEEKEYIGDVLESEHVYILMNEEYRISRNRRAEWFFSKLNGIITIPNKTELKDYSKELEVVSVIPVKPPVGWTFEENYKYRYRVLETTVVTFMSRNYRIVYCLDISPSVAAVDVQAGIVMFDGMFQALKISLHGLMSEFRIPGSHVQFQPKIHITVIAHSPFMASVSEQVLVHGVLLNQDTFADILRTVFNRLNSVENRIATVTASISEAIEKARDFSDRLMGKLFDEGGESVPTSTSSVTIPSDHGLVDLLRQGLIALHLLPENSTAALIIVTDGVISVPDGVYLDMILSQLRYNTVSCSFIQLSSPFHPHLCHGVLPYADLMRFVSSATFGAFFTSLPEIKDNDPKEMNIYHQAFLAWNFQKPLETMKTHPLLPVPGSFKPGEWSVRNQCFFSVRDMPIVKKQQYETHMNIDYMKVLSCRLREGFTIKEVFHCLDSKLVIRCVLPWKFLIQIEYTLIIPWPSQPKISCIVSLEGPYDFLHDVTCLGKKTFHSHYRQLMVSQFWNSQKILSESDKLLVHFNSFSANSSFYNIPDSLRNGVPLFYISSNTSVPTLQTGDFTNTQFENFWRPVCLLDTRVWQKWMHTHRIGILLEHDHPLPKHLHLPNSSGRFHVIQCRQTVMALNTLLKDWSSFVLVENNSYIKLMFKENEKTPFSFYIIRMTLKPPYVVLRLAFLIGTAGYLRHEAITLLRDKISNLTFPQRLREPPKWRVFNAQSTANSSKTFKRTWSDMHCCILLHKPVEKILLGYDRVPRNFFQDLLPQNLNCKSLKTYRRRSTFGFPATEFPFPWEDTNKMVPETFNAIARYLHHRRWIWCLQSTPTSTMSIDGAAFVLSTITKMRLQEGFRFAYSAAGTVNMIMELDMKIGNDEVVKDEEKQGVEKDNGYTPCVLQYVIFPPTASLISSESAEEGEGESVEESDELYLITECWVEPQSGRIVKSGPERTYLDNLEYVEIPTKVFELDKECIWALVTLDHLNVMCNNDSVHSPSDLNKLLDKKPKSLIPSEDHIELIPFEFQLKRILPKSRRGEMLFSLFIQDISMSFPIGVHDDLAKFCERANSTLYETWIASARELHDREVFLTPEHNKTILNLVLHRQNEKEEGVTHAPDVKSRTKSQVACPKWSCFIKGENSIDVLLILLPATLSDLKLLMLCQQSELVEDVKQGKSNRAVHLLPESEDPSEDVSQWPQTDKSARKDVADCSSRSEMVGESGITKPDIHSQTALEGECVVVSPCRKRLRVKSGGESGPVSKRASRKNSGDSTRPRTCSIDTFWATKYKKDLAKSNDNPGSDPNLIVSLGDPLKKSGLAESNADKTFVAIPKMETFPKNHRPKYGCFSLPTYVYYCCSVTSTEHLIFKTRSGKDDLEFDRRVTEDGNDILNYFCTSSREGTPEKGHNKLNSPEPKSEDSESGSSVKHKVIPHHCADLDTSFAKSYVHGLFRSLQSGFYIHSNDIKTAINICEETKVEINLSEFIKTICGHFKAKRWAHQESVVDGIAETGTSAIHSPPFETCNEIIGIHSFVKKRFRNILMLTFDQVKDHTGIYNYKFTAEQLNSGNISMADSKNTSDFEDVDSMTVKPESVCSDLLQVLSKDEVSNKSPDLEVEESRIIDDEFIVQTIENASDLESEVVAPMPLFLYLSCRYSYSEQSGTFSLNDIPTCCEELETQLEDLKTEDDLESLNLVMEFVFLTVPPDIDEFDSMNKSYSSSRGSSPFRIREDSQLENEHDERHKIYPRLPTHQLQAVKRTVDEVKWLLKDEITSFRWESNPVSESTLVLVASHVEKSRGKPGCLLHVVPLTFVNNAYTEGYDKFKERFRDLSLDGYRLQEEGSWFYLVDTKKIQEQNLEENVQMSHEIISEEINKRAEEISKFQETLERQEESKQQSIEEEPSIETATTVEMETSDGNRGIRPRARNMSGAECEEPCFENLNDISMRRDRADSQSNQILQLTTPSQLSEVSSLVESFITNEDGYEGDGSESGGEDGPPSDFDRIKTKLPPFWMIFKLNAEHVVVYFHCRYNEDDLNLFEMSSRLRERMLKILVNLRRIVNQDLLLQQLHDSRNCSTLLEPENEDNDFWEEREVAPIIVPPPPLPPQNQSEVQIELESELWQAESNINFAPGTFSCEVVWETKFYLHSRLGTGPGKPILSRGIQTLQTTLIAFEVLNRKNMFVYRDTSGNVFYLRLYRTQQRVSTPINMDKQVSDGKSISTVSTEDSDKTGDTGLGDRMSLMTASIMSDATLRDSVEAKTEDVVLLQVHGITEAGHEIKEQLVQSLRNKLDDAVLDILSVTLDRNPHCKLTPEDVHFIQKPNSSPDFVFKYSVNTFALNYLNAFAYYLHQNLLQFLNIPKYMDFKSENHFQDYTRVKDNNLTMENNVYIYNQSPGGTGSRGIACVSVALVDIHEKTICNVVWQRPSNEAFINSNGIRFTELQQVTQTDEIISDDKKTDVMVDICLWKQGRINIDLIKSYFATSIKHAIWDLAMEFHFLTAPISNSLGDRDHHSKRVDRRISKINISGEMSTSPPKASPKTVSPDSEKKITYSVERRNSTHMSANFFGERPAETESPPRPRSISFSARRSERPISCSGAINRAQSPQTLQSGPIHMGARGKFPGDSKHLGLSKLERGEVGRLHDYYGETMKKWCTFGNTLNVPSLRIVPISLMCRHSVDIIAREIEKIIQSVAPDNEPKQFWKVGSKANEFLAGRSRLISADKLEAKLQCDAEFKAFTKNYKKLKSLENVEETVYPPELLNLFKSNEDFDPNYKGHECLIVSRNFVHWKSCVLSEEVIDPLACIPEAHKNIYKFGPLLCGGVDANFPRGSQDKISRVSSNVGLGSLLKEPENYFHPVLIPRQRLLLANISCSQIVFHFYNWSKESGDRLVEHAKCLGLWLNTRSNLLSSILLQKAGLFHKQPLMRSLVMPPGFGIDTNPFSCGGAEVDVICRNHSPPNEISSGRLGTLKRGVKPSKATLQFLDCYRNLLHASLLKIPDISLNTLKSHGEQAVEIMARDNKEVQNTLFQYWLLRGPSASNVIGSDAIESFKQAARTIHFCMTPIIFLPRWRTEVAATRDNTVGIYKKPRLPVEEKRLQLSLKSDPRSRHGSGASQRSLESSKTRNRYSIWGLWSSSSSQSNPENQNLQSSNLSSSGIIKKSDEKWHGTLCKSFMQEYMQYLQTLGFIPIQSRNSNMIKPVPPRIEDIERLRNMSGASLVSSGSSQSGGSSQGFLTFGNFVRRIREDSGEKTLFYLQKSLPGGIILFEVGLSEPFFYAKIHALEATRIQTKKSRPSHTLSFLDECEKMKVLMHLHSFAYDFHLRSIHAYISGRQLIFKQGYHLTNFLDDFIKYYPKGPNFARNIVHIGLVTMQNVTTPAHILYNYILSHDKFYNLRVIRMNPLQPDGLGEQPNEFIMVHNSSKKVTYKDMEDENQYDDFDLTLLIAHDAPPFIKHYSVDPSVLRLKYYIVLTSRRELYPKINDEKNLGKFCTVNTPEALSQQKNAKMSAGTVKSRRTSLEERSSDAETPPDKKLSPVSGTLDGHLNINLTYQFEGIKEEKVNFVGYFSSHEQLMQEIVSEQTVWVDNYIQEIVGKAAVDCRRALLWQRLLVGGQMDEKNKNKKDLMYRETFGALTYWDFTELLELVQVRSLSTMDSRLSSLLSQPFSFYVSLMKLLATGNQKDHRYFVAPDASSHQMAVLTSNAHQYMIVLEVNKEKKTAHLNIVFKHLDDADGDQPLKLEDDVLTLIEYAVHACCYCTWSNLI